MDAENRRLREILRSRIVELEERDAIISRLRRCIRDYEPEAKGCSGARLPNQQSDVDAKYDPLASSSSPWEELVDRLPYRIPRPLAPFVRKASVTTPTTCDSSGDDDNDEDENDNYPRGSRSWDDGRRLGEMLDMPSSSSSSVTSEEEEKYPPRFAMDRKNPRRAGAIISIDGPSSSVRARSSERGGVTMGGKRRSGRRTNEFDDPNGVTYRPGPMVLPMMGGQRSSMKTRREGRKCRERGILVGRRRMRRQRGVGAGGIHREHDGESSLSCLRESTALIRAASVPSDNALGGRLDRIGGAGGVGGSMSDHEVIRAYAEEILRRANNVEEETMTRGGGDDKQSTETMRRSKRWRKALSANCWRGQVAIGDDEVGGTTTDDEDDLGSSASAYFDCASSTSDWPTLSAAGPAAATCRCDGQQRAMSTPAAVTVQVHIDSPAFWIGITSIVLSALVVIFLAIVAFVINDAYLPLSKALAVVC
jgi:hypothetical protein